MNKWRQIYDFTKNDDGSDNFKLLDPKLFKIVSCKEINSGMDYKTDDILESDKDFLFELNVDYGGSLSKDIVKTADGLMAFDIRTGVEAAQKTF